MKIIVCIKQVEYLYFHYGVDSKSNYIDPEKTVSMLNPYDEIAVEEAVQIKERLNDVEVTLITFGPESAESFLRFAFAFGADKMIHVLGNSNDPWKTAKILSDVINTLEYDLILCGKKTIDQNNQLVGTLLAEMLELPQVSEILELKLNTDSSIATIEKSLGRGNREVIECSIPALFTVEIGLNEPRYPKLFDRLKARSAPIQIKTLSEKDLNAYSTVNPPEDIFLSPLKPMPKSIFTPDSSLPAYERMQQILLGDPTSKKGIFLEGKPETIAKEIINILDQNKYI